MLSIYREKVRTYPRGAFVTSDVRRSGGTLSVCNAVNFMSAFLALLVTKNVNFMKMRNFRFESEESLSENALSFESIISKPTFSQMSLRMRSKLSFCRHVNDKA